MSASPEAFLLIAAVAVLLLLVRPDIMLQLAGVLIMIGVPIDGSMPYGIEGGGGSSLISGILLVGLGRGLYSLRTLVLLRRAADPEASAAVKVKRWGF